MIKNVILYIATLILLVLSKNGFSQSLELGVNLGLVANRYTVSQNYLGNSSWVRQGALNYSSRIGVQAAIKSMPNMYNTYTSTVKHGLLLELSACNCGGNLELVNKLDDDSYLVSKLDYKTWQADFSMLYELKINQFEFILGPSFTFHTYRGVSNSLLNSNDFVFPQDQIKQSYLGLDFGIGYRIDKFLISSRYHTNLSNFGEKTKAIPAQYGNHQLRWVLSYFIYEKRLKRLYRGLY